MEDYRPGAATDLERDLVRDLLRERKIHRARFTTRVKDVYGPRKITNDTGREVELDVVVGQSGERLLHLLRSYPDQEAARKDYQGTESFFGRIFNRTFEASIRRQGNKMHLQGPQTLA